jgi:hypothetical protein
MNRDLWISRTEVSNRLGIGYLGVRRLVESGRLGEKAIPGSRRLYNALDVDRIDRESTRVATHGGTVPCVAT